jgi:uncharacterized membrane protein HdeD (DUF308 family)
MGFFWLTIGITIIRRGQDEERYPGKHTALITGLVSIVTGLIVVTRRFTRQWVGEDLFFFVLGTVILTTGLLHMFSEQRIGGFRTYRQTRIHFLLGLFEVILGGLLILSPNTDRTFVYWAATAWTIVYGAFALVTAVRTYRDSKRDQTVSETSEEPALKS